MKRIVLYSLLFVLICTGSNFFYVYSGLYKKDIAACGAELMYTLDSSVYTHNVVYFGESSNFTFSEKDVDKRSISELLNSLGPNYKIATVSKGALHAGIFKQLIKRIPDSSSIKAIVLTVNLRSFGINWIESDLETNLSRSNIIYAQYPPLVKKFLLSFKGYDDKEAFKRKEIIHRHYKKDELTAKGLEFTTVRDWDKYMFHHGVMNEAGQKDIALTNVACHFIKNYAFELNPENPRISDLDDIIELCKAKNITLIFNLLPENYERAEKLCGPELATVMSYNVNYLVKRYTQKVQLVNNFELLGDSCFIDRDWPTEHYNFYGRNSVAQRVDSVLKKVLRN